MKSILAETVLVGGAIGFWAVALPAAAVTFPVIALWGKIGGALIRGAAAPGCGRPATTTA